MAVLTAAGEEWLREKLPTASDEDYWRSSVSPSRRAGRG